MTGFVQREPIDFFGFSARLHFEHERATAELRYLDIAAVCESPIERYLAAALMFCGCPGKGPERLPIWRLDASHDITYLNQPHWPSYLVITPQAPVDRFRVDFLFTMRTDGGRARDVLVVECDGHDFHEKTKEQAARDKSRDCQMVLNNLRVLRYTGSEIYRDPHVCAAQIFSVLSNIWLAEP